jgi:prepilin-type N-terminal cleavage/methylation domain-containing protein
MKKKAFTLIELLVVVLILGLLTTIAVGVFTTQVERAKYAAARSTISAMELAANRYQLDVGEFPPSGSAISRVGYPEGCGFFQLAVMHSMNGNSQRPASPRWKGPYLTVKRELLGDLNGQSLEDGFSLEPGSVQILDPWGQPYRYVRFGGAPDNYDSNRGTILPSSHPFSATETYYNPSTFQIVSKGGNGETFDPPYYGMDSDDVTNFGM